MRDKTMQAIRNFRTLANQVKGEIDRIDPDLKDSVREERIAKIWQTHGKNLSGMLNQVRAGKEYFASERMKVASPQMALIRRAWESDDNRPGLGAIAEAMSFMSPEQQLDLARDFSSPVLALRAVSNIKKMDLEPESRKTLNIKLQDMIGVFVDKSKIREYAEIEMQCLDVEHFQNKMFGGDAQKRASVGYEIENLKRIIASGEVPSYELERFENMNPVEKLNAARQ